MPPRSPSNKVGELAEQNPSMRSMLVPALMFMGVTYREVDRSQEGVKAGEEAVRISQELAVDNRGLLLDLADALVNLGRRISLSTNTKKAVDVIGQAIPIVRATASDNPAALAFLALALTDLRVGYAKLDQEEQVKVIWRSSHFVTRSPS